MSGYNCEVCGQPASVYAIEIRNAQKSERHLCDKHAASGGMTDLAGFGTGWMMINDVTWSSAQEAAVRGTLANLRGTANLARRHGRMPATVKELIEGMALQGDFPRVEITDPKVTALLNDIDGLIDFWRAH